MALITLKDLEVCAAMAREAKDLRERLTCLRGMSSKGGLTGMPQGGGVGDPTGTSVSKIDEIERMWQPRIEACLGHICYVEQAIQEIRDEKVRRIMRLYYIDGMIWEEVASKAYYSVKHAQRLRDRGLRILGIMEKKDVVECRGGDGA